MQEERCPICNGDDVVRHFGNDVPDELICRDCDHRWVAPQQTLPGVDWKEYV